VAAHQVYVETVSAPLHLPVAPPFLFLLTRVADLRTRGITKLVCSGGIVLNCTGCENLLIGNRELEVRNSKLKPLQYASINLGN
jgi:hypothetical protein